MVRYQAMASVFSHAIFAASMGTAFWRSTGSVRLLALGALFSVVPDMDVVGFRFGVQYGDLLGHRGITHSLAFAAVMATLGSFRYARSAPSKKWVAWLYLFLAMASHGLLDAMTDGGLGVAFFAPFSDMRYFFPWRPIAVSPIGVTAFFSERGLRVLQSEFKWIWLPSAIFPLLALLMKRRLTPASGPSAQHQ